MKGNIKWIVDVNSLLEFQNKKHIKYLWHSIATTCTNHDYTKAVPKVLTKEGYKCLICNK